MFDRALKALLEFKLFSCNNCFLILFFYNFFFTFLYVYIWKDNKVLGRIIPCSHPSLIINTEITGAFWTLSNIYDANFLIKQMISAGIIFLIAIIGGTWITAQDFYYQIFCKLSLLRSLYVSKSTDLFV